MRARGVWAPSTTPTPPVVTRADPAFQTPQVVEAIDNNKQVQGGGVLSGAFEAVVDRQIDAECNIYVHQGSLICRDGTGHSLGDLEASGGAFVLGGR